jgi:alpha-tubulin suppressor-like RCC1 family protein
VALKNDSTVVAWGSNDYGESQVLNGLNGIKAIAAGGNHTVALKADGTVFAWGKNEEHQCDVPKGLKNVKSIAAGDLFTVALTEEGNVLAWGNNDAGQCEIPRCLINVKSIAAKWGQTVALTENGSAVVWGDNYSGQWVIMTQKPKGNGIIAGLDNTVILKEDGTVAAFGNNNYGQCNVPELLTDIVMVSAGNRHTVALKKDGTVVAWGDKSRGQCSVPLDLKDVKAVTAGNMHTAALKNDGTVVAWGSNTSEQLNVPKGLADVKAISAGFSFTAALKNDGTVVAWGENSSKQLDVPEGLAGVKAISAGLNHALALKEDGTVVAWGSNGAKQCDVPPGLKNVQAIAAGVVHSVALKEDGTLVFWGGIYGNYGQCNIPDGVEKVKAIAAGGYNTVVLQEDGTVVGFGDRQFLIPYITSNGSIDVTPTIIPTPSPTEVMESPTPTAADTAIPTTTATVTAIPTPTSTQQTNQTYIPSSSSLSIATPTPTPVEQASVSPYPHDSGISASNTNKGTLKPTNTPLPKADLIITNVEYYPDMPKKGERVSLNVKVKNVGTAATKQGEKVSVLFYANESKEITCTSNISTSPIRVGGTINLISYRDIGGGFEANEPIYKVTAKVDYLDNISELDEGNNEFVKRKFRDISSKHWAKKEIEALGSKSILTGKASLYDFNPNDNITRAELVTALVKLLGLSDANTDVEMHFKDVGNKNWFYKYVAAAYKEGLINGKPDGYFMPDEKIARQDVALLFSRVINKYKIAESSDLNKDHMKIGAQSSANVMDDQLFKRFSDAKDISSYALGGMAIALKYNLVKGKTSDRIEPLSKASRAEAAVMLYRLYDFDLPIL